MKKNQYYKKRVFVHYLHRKSTFLLQNLVINRNFAIFATCLAYEVQ